MIPRCAGPPAPIVTRFDHVSIAPSSTDGSTSVDRGIELVLPARTDAVATLRILVSSLGADVGLDVDEIDDVRLAATEVFAVAADGPAERFTAVVRPTPGALGIRMTALDAPLELDPLATTILSTVVDELDVAPTGVSVVKYAGHRQG